MKTMNYSLVRSCLRIDYWSTIACALAGCCGTVSCYYSWCVIPDSRFYFYYQLLTTFQPEQVFRVVFRLKERVVCFSVSGWW